PVVRVAAGNLFAGSEVPEVEVGPLRPTSRRDRLAVGRKREAEIAPVARASESMAQLTGCKFPDRDGKCAALSLGKGKALAVGRASDLIGVRHLAEGTDLLACRRIAQPDIEAAVLFAAPLDRQRGVAVRRIRRRRAEGQMRPATILAVHTPVEQAPL